MAISIGIDAKNIDELQELGKLSGNEKTIVSYLDGSETRKVSIDTIIGYAANVLANAGNTVSMGFGGGFGGGSSSGGDLTFIPEGESISISQRTPGCFYLEETRQTSIRTQINIPTSVKISASLGLKRV